jgi:hypothetical protein
VYPLIGPLIFLVANRQFDVQFKKLLYNIVDWKVNLKKKSVSKMPGRERKRGAGGRDDPNNVIHVNK